MPRYGMTTPQGDIHYDDDPSWLQEKMLSAGPEFWNSDAGDAAVERGMQQLLLVFHEDHGFTVGYYEQDQSGRTPISYQAWMHKDFGKPVQVWVGGNPYFCAEAEFVPRDLAWAVVREFCDKGTR